MQEHLVFFANTILFAEAVVVRRSFLAAAMARANLVQTSSGIAKAHTEDADMLETRWFSSPNRYCLRRLSLFAARA